MKLIRINLKKYYPKEIHHNVYLNGFLYDVSDELNFKREAVLILPGGGYEFLSYREKDPIMFAFLAEGFNSFSLEYSCYESYPTPHVEVACAMHYINKHSSIFNIEKNKTSLIGFSAGGHLAATYGYLYKKLANNKSEERLIRPYSLILGYPVISLIKSDNEECASIITDDKDELFYLLSAERHISKDYPPTFAFATSTDTCVDPRNIKWLEKELKKKKVKNKCIMFKDGPHGLSLANFATANNDNEVNKAVSTWVRQASEFIYKLK